MNLIFASVCSGIEAASVAWNPLGWECAFLSEIEPFPCAVLKHHYPKVQNLGDMTKFYEWPKRKLDVLIGGTPCQSFSIAGLRKGMDDPRGNLVLVFLGIVDKFRPTWVCWENVPGVHSSWCDEKNSGQTEASKRTAIDARRLAIEAGFDPEAVDRFGEFEEVDQTNDFDCFIAGLEQLGYGVATTILDAQFFGLAQRRKRVFVVGHIGGLWQRAAAVLFDAACLRGDSPPIRQARENIAPSISARTKGGGGLGTDADCDGACIAIGFDSNQGGDTQLGATNEKSPPLKGIARHAVASTLKSNSGGGGFGSDPSETFIPVGINGSEIGYALRSNPSHSGDKNTTLVASTLNSSRGDQGYEPGETFVPEIVGQAMSSKWSKGTSGPAGDEVANLVPVAPLTGNPWADNESQESLLIPKQGMSMRRLTPKECCRLQGFPDDYLDMDFNGKPVTDGHKYKALGNSMATPVIQWIGKRIEMVEMTIFEPRGASAAIGSDLKSKV